MNRARRKGGLDRGALPDQRALAERFGGIRHARFHEPDVVYHVLVRTFQGRFLLAPDKAGRLPRLIAGVLGRAQERFPSLRLFADAWLSNHAHLLLQGDPDEIPAFMAFVEREISRRWGPMIGWSGTMFQTYQSTALPTAESQHRAFEYVLAQSTKEHLVTSPLKWPGAHCAKDLTKGRTRRGVWFDGTRYGKALHQRLARKRNRTPPPRTEFEEESTARFEKLPVLADLSDAAYRAHVSAVVAKIEQEAAAERRRTGRRVLGRRAVFEIAREERSELPRPPWFEERRRMICWASRLARETREYLERYWHFQREFREASRRYLEGELETLFPPFSFRPPLMARPTPGA